MRGTDYNTTIEVGDCLSAQKSSEPNIKAASGCPGDDGEVEVIDSSIKISIIQRLGLTKGSPETIWLNGNLTSLEIQQVNNLYLYLDGNTTTEATEFGMEAIRAWMAKGEVDFEQRLINNPLLDDFLKGRMSPNELALFENLSLVQKAAYLRAAAEAYTYAEIFYPQPVRNRKGDAVKHALWNALSTNYIGASLTKQLTDAHEDIVYEPDYPNHFKETEMDMFNNAKGRELATQYGSLIFQLVEDALDDGELRYLNHLIFLNGFYNATNISQLTPTNQ